MKETHNCRIASTMLGREDHGVMTCFLHLEGEGWGQGFGGYCFDEWNQETESRDGTGYAIEFIAAILDTLNVTTWEKLPGTVCRIERDGRGYLPNIVRIGHIYKDQWFCVEDLRKKHFPEPRKG